MSGEFKPTNPFGDFGSANPYATPSFSGQPPQHTGPDVSGKVTPPAIAMLVAAAIGLIASLYNFGFSFTEPVIDPNAPEWLQEIQRNATGMTTTVIQGVFIVINLLIIFGAAQMMRMRTWGLAVAVSVLSMLNCGTFCCVLGLPFGIWSIIVLMSPDVKLAFAARA